jgi:MATE family multidrug resistance protein
MSTNRYPAKITKFYLLKLSLPIFFSNLAVPLVGVVDTALVGHLGASNFLAATSIATTVITMVLWSFGFLRMSTVGLVAQDLGKGNYREIVITVIRNLSIAFFVGILIILFKGQLLSVIENFFSTSSETQILIKNYISIRILSAPAELSLYVLVGLFLGLQKTYISSLFVSTFSVLNIIFSIYFVKILDLSIAGIALGTVVSAYLIIFIFLIYTYYFIKNKFNIIPRYKKIFITKKLIKLFNINFDIFIRTIFLTFVFVWITFQSSKLGEDYLAVNTILMQFIIMASFFLDAYAFATEGAAGFALGRKVKKSFLFCVTNAFEISFFTSLIISFIYLFTFKIIINIFTDIEYLRFLSYSYMYWIILIPPIASFCYQFDGIFIGTSTTQELRNSMVISVIIFISISLFFIKYLNNHGIWFSLLIFMVLRSLTLRFYFQNIIKKF